MIAGLSRMTAIGPALVGSSSDERPLSAQPRRRERVLLPLFRHWPTPSGSPGRGVAPICRPNAPSGLSGALRTDNADTPAYRVYTFRKAPLERSREEQDH